MTEREERARRKPSGAGYVITIVVNAVLLVVAHNALSWGVPFLTEEFLGALWAFDLSLGATMAANLIFLVYDAGWFRHLAQAVLSVLSIVVAYTVYRVFPFEFGSAFWSQAARVLLILGMVGAGIGVVVELARVPFGRD